MALDNEPEVPENYDDMELALDRQEEVSAILRNLSDFYLSQEQLSDKGKLLGHYKPRGLARTYIAVYERAVVGRMRADGSKRIQDISWGYACLAEAIVENRVLYAVGTCCRVPWEPSWRASPEQICFTRSRVWKESSPGSTSLPSGQISFFGFLPFLEAGRKEERE